MATRRPVHLVTRIPHQHIQRHMTTSPSSLASSAKRPSSSTGEDTQTKKPKLFAMFAPKGSAPPSLWKACPPSILHYTSPTYSPASPASSSTPTLVPRKVAFFDLDGTLISVRSGAKFPRDAADWRWWNQEVPRKLKKVAGEGNDGHLIVLITNQNGLRIQTDKNINKHRTWKTKIEAIAQSLPDVPFQLIAALEKDHFRKPMAGMFEYYAEQLKQQGIAVDVAQSYYVGDAAGRPARVGHAKDHGDGDRKWADNLGLKFYTPEMYFGDQPNEVLPPFDGFRPRDLATGPLFKPSSSPLIPQPLPPSEIVLFVGSPGAGKSHFFRTFFESEGYVRVNQDEIGTRAKCLKMVEEIVGKEGRRCVVDNTNRDRATRGTYVAIAKKFKVPIRCFHFDLDPALANHNNLYRLYPSAPGAHVPLIALNSFKSGFEEPSAAEEGFTEVKKIGYVGWTGGDENGGAGRKRWEGWMS